MSSSASANSGVRESIDPEGKPLLAMLDVEKRFESGTLALSGFNLRIGAGSFVSLLGPSGCGKSTVLRLVSGLAAPTVGSIRWSTAARNGARPRLSFVFQEATLMPWTDVLGNVALPLKLAGIPQGAATSKAMSALGAVGLASFERAFPAELSGGMKMRVSLARAIITDPDVLLLDEPFAALDEITRLKLTSDLAALWRERGFTAIFVTHSVLESVYLSQRVIVMAPRPGRVIAELSIEPPTARDEAFRTSPEYAESCQAVSQALKAAMAQ